MASRRHDGSLWLHVVDCSHYMVQDTRIVRLRLKQGQGAPSRLHRQHKQNDIQEVSIISPWKIVSAAASDQMGCTADASPAKLTGSPRWTCAATTAPHNSARRMTRYRKAQHSPQGMHTLVGRNACFQ